MKKFIISMTLVAALPISMGLAQNAVAADDDTGGSVTTTTTQYDSPVASTSVNSRQTQDTTTHVAQKQMPRHPAGMRRHAGAVAASGASGTY